MRRIAWAVLLFCGLVTPVDLVAAETVVVVNETSVTAGRPLTLTVWFGRAADDAPDVGAPDRLRVQFLMGNRSVMTTADREAAALQSTGTEAAAGPGTRHAYTVMVPRDIRGQAQLRLADFPANLPLIMVAPAEPGTGWSWADTPTGDRLQALDALYQPYLSNLSFYEPTYFSVGTNPEKSKFQLSFKYRMVRPESRLGKSQPWTTGLHLAYTQVAYWDLASSSAPFEDTSYKPELFYLTPGYRPAHPLMYSVNMQTGFQHESNGRGGDDSRSTNTLYVQPIFVFANAARDAGVMVAPRIMAYVGNDEENNADLPAYRGYVDLMVAFGYLQGFVIDTHVRYGRLGGSVQVSASYPLGNLLSGGIEMHAYAQYFNGYAENLLRYNQTDTAYRIGLAIAR